MNQMQKLARCLYIYGCVVVVVVVVVQPHTWSLDISIWLQILARCAIIFVLGLLLLLFFFLISSNIRRILGLCVSCRIVSFYIYVMHKQMSICIIYDHSFEYRALTECSLLLFSFVHVNLKCTCFFRNSLIRSLIDLRLT